MIKCALHQVLRIYADLITYLAQTILSFTTIVILLNCVYPNPPCPLSFCEFFHMSPQFGAANSEVKGACSVNCATEAI